MYVYTQSHRYVTFLIFLANQPFSHSIDCNRFKPQIFLLFKYLSYVTFILYATFQYSTRVNIFILLLLLFNKLFKLFTFIQSIKLFNKLNFITNNELNTTFTEQIIVLLEKIQFRFNKV